MAFLAELISKRPWIPGAVILLICATALGTAFFVQYVMGIEPCELCMYQRMPYAAAGLFALFAIIGKPGGFTQQMALVGCALAFSIGSGLAVYHMGVEESWWTSGCSGSQAANMSLDQLKAAIMSEPLKPCDQKDWVIFGLSITVYNTVFSAFFALLSFTGLTIIRKLKAHTR